MTDRASGSQRYVAEKTLGRGGMATVYLARDRVLDRQVALKLLAEHFASDEAFRDRFMREARLAAKLVHPNVVQIYDVDEDERGLFIVMEYVEGDTLADELRRRGRLPAAEVVSVGIQLCSALEAAHGSGLVHRDIKPQNILRRPGGQVKLADFGIARSLTGTDYTEIGTVLGTAAYLAPEQARGEPVTAAADIYALGVVLYELATGQTPFSADTLPELLLKREQGTVVAPSSLAADLPVALEAVVLRCLASRPADRPSSAAALAGELAAASDEPVTDVLPVATGLLATEVMPATAATVAFPRRGHGWRHHPWWARLRRLPVAVLAAGALLVLALILLFALADSNSGGGAPTTSASTTPATTKAGAVATARAPATPQQAIADVRAAIYRAQKSGQLDPTAAVSLNQSLDQIAQSLANNASQDAARTLAGLIGFVSDLARGGQLSSAGLAQIGAPLSQLAALLPAPLPLPGSQGGKHGNRGKHGND